jgi:hypothetical protein
MIQQWFFKDWNSWCNADQDKLWENAKRITKRGLRETNTQW